MLIEVFGFFGGSGGPLLFVNLIFVVCDVVAEVDGVVVDVFVFLGVGVIIFVIVVCVVDVSVTDKGVVGGVAVVVFCVVVVVN